MNECMIYVLENHCMSTFLIDGVGRRKNILDNMANPYMLRYSNRLSILRAENRWTDQGHYHCYLVVFYAASLECVP